MQSSSEFFKNTWKIITLKKKKMWVWWYTPFDPSTGILKFSDILLSVCSFY